MNQNQKAVLMCYNIPKGIKEDNLYELFSIAGPVESILYGKSGKSVFVIYEFREAVTTAKEVLKDVKLYGRPIRMFDKEDIEKIHAKQEEELDMNQHEMDYSYDGPPAHHRRYEEFSRHDSYNNRNYHSEGPRYQNNYSRESNYQRFPRFQTDERRYGGRETYQRNTNYSQDSESTRTHSEQPTSKNNSSYRPDLSSSPKQNAPRNNFSYQQNRREESHGMNDTSENFRNPYEEQVSRYNNRNSYRYEDYRNKKHSKPYDRSNQRGHHQSHSSQPSYSSKNSFRNHQRYQNF